MAEQTMVERVAAILDCDVPAMMGTNLDDLSPEKWKEHRHQHFIRMARAAIETMREPTEAMGRAGMATPHAEHYVELSEKEGAALVGEPVIAPIHGAIMAYEAWHAMIDAALKEKVDG